MIVFKTFLRIVKKCIFPIILYTVILVLFSSINISTEDNNMNFTASKPDIYIINNDKYEGITKSLIDYMSANSNIIELKDTKEAIDDAIFYRDVNFIMEIPVNFNEEYLKGQELEIKIETTGDYPSVQAKNLLNRYLSTARIYQHLNLNEEDLIKKVNATLENKVNVEITSSLDTSVLNKATTYYNFLNYAFLAGSIYVICLVLSSFKNTNIKKRTLISSMKINRFNRNLLLSNSLFAFILWLIYVILSFILVGESMFSMHGLIYIINSFIFAICTLCIAFLLGNTIKNKDAINGIINVIALGSSFLCGAFVPMEYLPKSVLNMAHILPSYYYIKNNNLISTLETINLISLKPIILNMVILLMFVIIFIVITNVITRRSRKIA